MDPSKEHKKIETPKSDQKAEEPSWWDKLIESKKRTQRNANQRKARIKALRGK